MFYHFRGENLSVPKICFALMSREVSVNLSFAFRITTWSSTDPGPAASLHPAACASYALHPSCYSST